LSLCCPLLVVTLGPNPVVTHTPRLREQARLSAEKVREEEGAREARGSKGGMYASSTAAAWMHAYAGIQQLVDSLSALELEGGAQGDTDTGTHTERRHEEGALDRERDEKHRLSSTRRRALRGAAGTGTTTAGCTRSKHLSVHRSERRLGCKK